MKILAIEASSLVASVAIVEDDLLKAEYTLNHKVTHSQTLLPMIDEICKMSETDPQTFDAIAVAAGPGSFTGLRIGVATAKGIAMGLDLPTIHVPTLDAMAYNLFGAQGLICPIMDARRQQTYTGVYRFEQGELKTVMDGDAMAVTDLIEKLNALQEKVTFVGDGIPAFREIIEEQLLVEHAYAPAGMNRQRASSVAVLGAKLFAEGKTVSADELLPDYLRVSQAEREREEKEKAMK